MSTELPGRWAERMIARGYTDPRYTDERASMSALSEATGVHTTTIANAIYGRGRAPSARTVNALVGALGADVAAWLDRSHSGTWEPPAEASMLTNRQRKALDELIRAMTNRGEGHDRPAATSEPESGPGYQPDNVTHLYEDEAAYNPPED